jgi:(p)ppGpp synthase/HD superfamily hydrolase
MSLHDSSLGDPFEEALIYAFRLHRNQIRKGTSIPYFSHLMGVAAIVLEDGGDEDETIAALLHDAVEDQGGFETLAEIERRFGKKVASIVEECSDSFSTPKPPWKERKIKYLQNLKSASPSALKVSLADKLHNIRSLTLSYLQDGENMWKNFRGGKEGTLWYYHELSKKFHQHGENILLSEFDQSLHHFDGLIEARGKA